MTKSDAACLTGIRDRLNLREGQLLVPLAVPSSAGHRRQHEPQLEQDFRPAFSLDVDRILHSRAYTRYIDKTQVFYLVRNDHITHRVLHVQLVSKIARTIGRFLGLNEDLIEAIALGHDIGHCPFGHDGERFLSELCLQHGIGSFNHNVQSVQFLDRVERQGRGWNLCLQTLDGILCHDGEVHSQALKPQPEKSFATLSAEMAGKTADPEMPLYPMTLEGCVVRMADTISYIGRDIEDAIRLNMIQRREIPPEVAEVLGSTNGTIVYRLVNDIIAQSIDRPYVAFSPEVSEALHRLKRFNLERIYLNPSIKRHAHAIRELFALIFTRYYDDLLRDDRSSVLFTRFLNDKIPAYREEHQPAHIVRDFISGMTDQFFLRQCPESLRPEPLVC
jgi:dGTPase